MRLEGKLTEWNDSRGFGFITPLDGGPRVFVHISEFPRYKRRPIAMDLVSYTVEKDERGRPRARNVLFIGPAGRPRGAKLSTSLALRVLAGLVVLAVLSGGVLFYGFSSGARRVSERPPDSPQVSQRPPVSPPVVDRPPVSPHVSERPAHPPQAGKDPSEPRPAPSADQAIASAFQNRTSGIQVSGQGVVERVLPDDHEGSRHQRFILRLASGQTVLVAHNIDLAARINALGPGDTVGFHGEYEWNPQGGVIHWTHHDPGGQHISGWLLHNGSFYQ